MNQILAASETYRLPDLPSGWSALDHAILADGAIAILADDQAVAEAYDFQKMQGQLKGRVARARARLFTFDGQRLIEHFTIPLEARYPTLDRLPNGRWVIADGRTGGEPNARLLGPDGELLARFMLGDGIQHLKCDARGRIWVGWFDEGIFGNDEWKIAGRRWPPSASGVACFDQTGGLLWEHGGVGRDDAIADCYALNVSGDVAWACPYTDFPILRLTPGQPDRRWRNERSGASALAISGENLLLAGGYNDERGQIALLRLGERRAAGRAAWKMAVPNGVSDRPSLLDGRGGAIHRVMGGLWQRWDVVDVVRRAD